MGSQKDPSTERRLPDPQTVRSGCNTKEPEDRGREYQPKSTSVYLFTSEVKLYRKALETRMETASSRGGY
jgi:hypothetical protein